MGSRLPIDIDRSHLSEEGRWWSDDGAGGVGVGVGVGVSVGGGDGGLPNQIPLMMFVMPGDAPISSINYGDIHKHAHTLLRDALHYTDKAVCMR